ncbi:MAG: hypothetical protein Q4A83_06685 [Bacillota bacterium]|nr:hypothetical protein [Bacillota bacterium]
MMECALCHKIEPSKTGCIKAVLATFLEYGTITQVQYDKSLHDFTVKMEY